MIDNIETLVQLSEHKSVAHYQQLYRQCIDSRHRHVSMWPAPFPNCLWILELLFYFVVVLYDGTTWTTESGTAIAASTPLNTEQPANISSPNRCKDPAASSNVKQAMNGTLFIDHARGSSIPRVF